MQYGVQIVPDRAPDITEEGKKMYYQKARELGFDKVAVAVTWCNIEPWENAYNLYSVEKIIEYADEYNLDLEILWFGSNVCGSTFSSPNYVRSNPKRFPMINNNLDFSNEELLEREVKAIKVLMDYIYDNDTERRVSMIQIENEPNFQNAQNEQRTHFLNYLNTLGLSVKNSPYKVLTRVNLVINDSYLDFENTLPEEILSLEGIDIVGPDVYTNSWTYYKKFIERFSANSMSDNIMHFAEAPGQVNTYIKLVIKALANHSGYYTYELKTSENTSFDLGIFRKDNDEWIKRDGTGTTAFEWVPNIQIPECVTDDIILLNNMISAISEQLILCGENISAIDNANGSSICGYNFTFNTDVPQEQNHISMVLKHEDYFYLFTPASTGSFTLELEALNASIGSFADGEWIESGTQKIENGVLNVIGGNVYRIRA